MSAGGLTPFLAPALGAALADWLASLGALHGSAPNTVAAYRRDVARFLGFLATHQGGAEGLARVASVTQTDLRAWMADERGRGLSPRSLARALRVVQGLAGSAAMPALGHELPQLGLLFGLQAVVEVGQGRHHGG